MQKISRRTALKLIGITSTSGILAACAPASPAKPDDSVQKPETDEQLPKPDGYDVVSELKAYSDVMTLTGYYNLGAKVSSENYFKQWVMENFKIDLQTTYTSGEDYPNKVRTLAAANQLPDVLLDFNHTVLDELADSDLLLPLDDLFTNYAPQTKIWFVDELKDMVRSKDGKLYIFMSGNYAYGNEELTEKYLNVNFPQFLGLNMEMLKAVNMEVPKTPDELYEFLKAAVQLPPVDGKQIIGMASILEPNPPVAGYPGDSTNFNNNRTAWMHMFEQFEGTGVAGPDAEKKMMKFAYDYPAYVKYLKFFSKLYREDLVDKDAFTMTQDQIDDKYKTGRVALLNKVWGLLYAANSAITGENYDKGPYEFIQFLSDPAGNITNRNLYEPLVIGSWFYGLNKNVKDPARIAKYIEWHLSDEGLMFDNYGPPDSSKTRNVWWYEEGEPLQDMKLPGKQTIDLELQRKWDNEKPGWESEECGTWGVNTLGLRNQIEYFKPGEFGVCLATEIDQEIDKTIQLSPENLHHPKDLKMTIWRIKPLGDIAKQKGPALNDILNKWEVKIMVNAKDDAEVDSMYAQMMEEARKAGYDEIAKEAYTIYESI